MQILASEGQKKRMPNLKRRMRARWLAGLKGRAGQACTVRRCAASVEYGGGVRSLQRRKVGRAASDIGGSEMAAVFVVDVTK